MSHPTIHPCGDGTVEIRHHGEQVAVLSDRDAETLGQALADLYGLAGDPAGASRRTEPAHGAWPAATARADWVPGALDDCAACGRPVEFAAHQDGRPGGWRHLTSPAGQPEGGGRS